MAKLRVGLIFGGRSVEHEISLISATSILAALDPSRYEVTLIAVDHDGQWHLGDPSLPLDAAMQGENICLPVNPGGSTLVSAGALTQEPGRDLDVIFPIIHGRGGEDGALQGLLELADIAYVGSGVLGSSIQMDKEVTKRLLQAAGLPVTPWVCIRGESLKRVGNIANEVFAALETPLFVKPANQGSSVGNSRVDNPEELVAAVLEAARFDTKVLVERAIEAREIEVAVLGNDPIEASVPGEIRTGRSFYDYKAKYLDKNTELLVPAPLDASQVAEVQKLAVAATQILEGIGFARIDFLLDKASGEFFINEVNSIPGFTEGSMFPLLWQESGLGYAALLDRMIELALERHQSRSALETRYQ
jgi:D-alanine-D-alanine ligase